MPAYTTITNGLVAVGAKPFATTIQALRDNPLAIAEGDPTAPKIRQRHVVSGAAAATQTLTGLGDYSGFSFEMFFRLVSGGVLQVQHSSDNGATFSTAQTVFTNPIGATHNFIMSGSLDFATGAIGAVGGAYTTVAPPSRFSATVTGISLSTNAISFSGTGFDNCVVMIRPNGGA